MGTEVRDLDETCGHGRRWVASARTPKERESSEFAEALLCKAREIFRDLGFSVSSRDGQGDAGNLPKGVRVRQEVWSLVTLPSAFPVLPGCGCPHSTQWRRKQDCGSLRRFCPAYPGVVPFASEHFELLIRQESLSGSHSELSDSSDSDVSVTLYLAIVLSALSLRRGCTRTRLCIAAIPASSSFMECSCDAFRARLCKGIFLSSGRG